MCVVRKKTANPARPLDQRDRAILAALAEDAWLTYAALGERAALSPSAAQRRVERLVADGVILGAQVRVAADALGKPLRLYVLVELVEESSRTVAAFARRLAAEPAIVEAHYVAGGADIVVVMQAASMAEYADFAEKHLNGNAAVRRYKTLTCLRALL
jgi:Lrp/AsnC family leucine-responsive transcriptional regulator